MTGLIDTTEMYLKSIYELLEEGLVPMRARITERLAHSGPTVSQTVARLERDDLVELTEDRRLRLTPTGLSRAAGVMRKHRLAEVLLLDVLGVEWHKVHEEACRWEHVISDEVQERMATVLRAPAVSPYGLPIPTGTQIVTLAGTVLCDAPAGEAVLVSIGEIAQAEECVLSLLGEVGCRPGARIVTRHIDDETLRVEGENGAAELSLDIARHLRVNLV